jgi:hypothetical protein
MSTVDKKQKIFGKIAAARTLTDSMPKLKKFNSIPSINNKSDIIGFLTDLIKSFVGAAALMKIIVDTLTISLQKLEVIIKNALKTDLKEIVSCGINPSIPDFLKSTGDGIVIELKKIDFSDLLKTDPNSVVGKLLYNDVTPNPIDSSDFNTFLYGVVQDDGITHTWKNMLDFTFVSLDPTGVNPNNSLTIKCNPSFNSKTLNDLNNDYIDSLSFFAISDPTGLANPSDLINPSTLINKIIDTIYGTASSLLNKTLKQLETEAKINMIVDRITNAEFNETITEAYFEFDDNDLSQIELEANNRKKGVYKVEASNDFNSSIPESSLTLFNEQMGTAVTTQDKKTVITNNLEAMAEKTAENAKNEEDKITIKQSFFQNIINALNQSIVSVLLSPKVLIVFMVNFKIINGPDAGFENPIDFILKNKRLFRAIIKELTAVLIEILLTFLMKQLVALAASQQIKIKIDLAKNKVVQLASLVGIPPLVLRIIKGLT